jgi:hypothetical protein
LNIHQVDDVRQTEIHTAELIVPDPCAFKDGVDVEKLRTHNSPGIKQISA